MSFRVCRQWDLLTRDSILEQMRLESLRGNWSRVRVGSRKINRVFLKETDSTVSRWIDFGIQLTPFQDLKLRYYDLIVNLALQEDNYLEACSAYQEVWDTEEVKEDPSRELNVRASSLESTLTNVNGRSSRTSSSTSSLRPTITNRMTCYISYMACLMSRKRPFTSE